MTNEFIPFGEPSAALDPDNLRQNVSKKILKLCGESKDFEVVELRHLTRNNETTDLIIVECVNDQVPSRNPSGIKVRERLALVFTPDKLPEVRALRSNFPTLPHMNHVPPGEPASLCLYADTWHSLERTWTPQKHLQRILWWLTEAAKGTVHRDDQALEPLYFESSYELVLPPDFEEKMDHSDLVLVPIPIPLGKTPNNFKVIRGYFQTKRNERPEKTSNKVSRLPIVAPATGRYVARGPLWIPQKAPKIMNCLIMIFCPSRYRLLSMALLNNIPTRLGNSIIKLCAVGDPF